MHFAGARSVGLRANRKQREDKYKINDPDMDEINIELSNIN
jgi:hypothetical protein